MLRDIFTGKRKNIVLLSNPTEIREASRRETWAHHERNNERDPGFFSATDVTKLISQMTLGNSAHSGRGIA